MQTGTVSRLWLRRRSWRFKIHFWRNIVRFWKSYICSNKLDVQETNCCFSQFNRIWNHLVGHWTEIGWFARSGTMGSNCFCSWKCFSCFRSIGETWEWWLQTPQVSQQNRCDERHWFCSFKCPIRASRSFIVCIWRQWSSDQYYHYGQKSNNETRVKNPQSCAWLVFWQNQFGPQDPNQICWHQKATRRHV